MARRPLQGRPGVACIGKSMTPVHDEAETGYIGTRRGVMTLASHGHDPTSVGELTVAGMIKSFGPCMADVAPAKPRGTACMEIVTWQLVNQSFNDQEKGFHGEEHRGLNVSGSEIELDNTSTLNFFKPSSQLYAHGATGTCANSG